MCNKNVVECKKCLLNSEIAKISKFDNDYYCDECRQLLEFPPDIKKIKAQWDKYIKSIKSDNRHKYNVLFALSGGKDSVAALYLTVKKYGLRPLAFTVDHGFKSDVIMDNCRSAVDSLGLDWIVIKVSDSIKHKIREIISAGGLPCVYCNKLWKADYFKQVVEFTNIKTIFTGGDTLVNNKAIIDKPEWAVDNVGLPLALEFLTEQEIYDMAYTLGWKDPSIKGWDTDCIAAGASLYNYRNIHNCNYHIEEIRHLSHRVRYGILDKETARSRLFAKMDVDPDILKIFGLR